MNWIKILIALAVFGLLAYLVYKWKISRESKSATENIQTLESQLESELEPSTQIQEVTLSQ
jgi:cyanate permease